MFTINEKLIESFVVIEKSRIYSYILCQIRISSIGISHHR